MNYQKLIRWARSLFKVCAVLSIFQACGLVCILLLMQFGATLMGQRNFDSYLSYFATMASTPVGMFSWLIGVASALLMFFVFRNLSLIAGNFSSKESDLRNSSALLRKNVRHLTLMYFLQLLGNFLGFSLHFSLSEAFQKWRSALGETKAFELLDKTLPPSDWLNYFLPSFDGASALLLALLFYLLAMFLEERTQLKKHVEELEAETTLTI